MEKRQLMKNLLFLLFLFPTMIFAQLETPGTIFDHGKIIDLDKEGDLLVQYEGECVPYTRVTVNLANLVEVEESLYGIQSNPLIPTLFFGGGLYLQYQVGGVVGLQELDDTFVHLLTSTNDIEIYQKEIKIYLNINEALSNCTIENSIPFSFRILNFAGTVVPIYNFSNSDDIFDCGYFDETECNCTEPQSCQGNGINANYWSGQLKNYNFCEDCGPQDVPIDIEDRSNKKNDSDLIISPNPFTANAKLELTIAKDSPVEVIIYNATGSVVTSSNEQVSKGEYTKEFQTVNWQNGVYFGRVRIGDKTESFQMIKID